MIYCHVWTRILLSFFLLLLLVCVKITDLCYFRLFTSFYGLMLEVHWIFFVSFPIVLFSFVDPPTQQFVDFLSFLRIWHCLTSFSYWSPAVLAPLFLISFVFIFDNNSLHRIGKPDYCRRRWLTAYSKNFSQTGLQLIKSDQSNVSTQSKSMPRAPPIESKRIFNIIGS